MKVCCFLSEDSRSGRETTTYKYISTIIQHAVRAQRRSHYNNQKNQWRSTGLIRSSESLRGWTDSGRSVTWKHLKHLHSNKPGGGKVPPTKFDWQLKTWHNNQRQTWRQYENDLTQCPLNVFCLFQFTQLSSGSKFTDSKSSIERFSECGLDSVEESHGVRDAVEGQNTCTVIQVHSNSGGLRTWDGSLDFVVIKLITVCGTI